jgi:hypothetical protein
MNCAVCHGEIPEDRCIRCGDYLEPGQLQHCKNCRYVNERNLQQDEEFKKKGFIPHHWNLIMADTLMGLDARCDRCRGISSDLIPFLEESKTNRARFNT